MDFNKKMDQSLVLMAKLINLLNIQEINRGDYSGLDENELQPYNKFIDNITRMKFIVAERT
mgnify:CR=1 FL=1